MFKIKANPTFTGKVSIPVAGGQPVDVALVFRHRTKAELEEWNEKRKGADDVSSFLDMVQGWVTDKDEAKALEAEPFEEEFTKGNVELLLQHRIGVALATYLTYVDELTKHREKN